MFAPGLAGWREQYDRVLRGFDRLRADYFSSVEYHDDLCHFFQDCWSLKDWIRNDPALSVGKAIEAEVATYRPLMIVADLANASKHLVRDTHRVGAYATSNDVTVYLGERKPIEVEYAIELADGSRLDEKQLAREAIDAWQAVLKSLGL